MQNKLQKAFKETPNRFRCSIESAITEAESTDSQKHSISRGWKITLAVILILALIPTAIIGASKIIGSISAEKEGNFGVKITAASDPDTDYPEYVKMHINAPEGFAEVPGTDGLEYYQLSTNEPYTDGISLMPLRASDNNPFNFAYFANGYDETVIAGHTAYKIIPTENYRGYDRIYVYYEDVNVILLIFYKEITEQQLTDFIAGISCTEGTADDHTELILPEVPDEGKQTFYVPDYTFIEKPLDTAFTFGEYNESDVIENPSVSAKVSDIRILENISGLDENGFNPLYQNSDIADENGSILPHTREVWQYGDGLETKDVLISSEEVERKLVLIDFEYVNLTAEDKTVYIPWRLSAMIKCSDGSFKPYGTINEDENIRYGTEIADSEICYMSNHGEGKSFYSIILEANETKTVTVGFIADADKLDELYLSCCPSADSIYSPEYPDDNTYTYFLMKVL